MPGTIVWYPQFVALMVLGFILASCLVWKISKPLAILSIYCLFSYIFISNQHPRALLCLILAYIGIGLIVTVSKIENTTIIYKSIVWMSVIQFGMLILQKFNLDPFFCSITNRNLSDVVGFVGSHNQLGIYYAAVAPILLHFCLPLVVLSAAAAIFASCSSAGTGVLVSIYSYFLLIRYKIAVYVLIPLTFFAAFLMIEHDALVAVVENRIKVWNKTIEQSIKGIVKLDYGNGMTNIHTFNPLTGAGIGSFMVLSPKSQGEEIFGKGYSYEKTPRWEHAHNDIIESFFEFGYIGLMIIGWIISEIINKFKSAFKTKQLVVSFCSLIAIAVSSLGVYVIHAPVSYFMFCLILGLFYAEVKNARTFSTQTKSIA